MHELGGLASLLIAVLQPRLHAQPRLAEHLICFGKVHPLTLDFHCQHGSFPEGTNPLRLGWQAQTMVQALSSADDGPLTPSKKAVPLGNGST